VRAARLFPVGRVSPNVIRAERSEQETNSEIERLRETMVAG